MKIIHCADLHLGSSLVSLPKEIREQRRQEINEAFINLIKYATENNIYHIILAGDVFDSDMPVSTDKSFFYTLVDQNPQITFFYLKGNHDQETSTIEEYPNLKTFDKNNWTYYDIDNVKIAGIEISNDNQKTLYESLSLTPDQTNIVILHGDINKDIDLNKLANKNIDYLALGHLHSYQTFSFDQKKTALYSGCLEGRGFDECGSKGFVVLDIEGKKVNYQFVKNSIRKIYIKTINLDGAEDLNKGVEIVKNNLDDVEINAIVRLILKGKINFNPNELKNIKNLILKKYYYFDFLIEATRKINLSAYENDLSLKGEFIRVVLSDSSLDEAKKEVIINYGLKFLDNEKEIDI